MCRSVKKCGRVESAMEFRGVWWSGERHEGV